MSVARCRTARGAALVRKRQADPAKHFPYNGRAESENAKAESENAQDQSRKQPGPDLKTKSENKASVGRRVSHGPFRPARSLRDL